MRIGITCDLRKDYLALGFTAEQVAEFDSEETLQAIVRALGALGHEPDVIGHARELCRRLVAGERWDLVFNICEGLHGRSREAQVPAILDVYDIPYTFSDPLTSAVTLDKAAAKRLVQACGLRTAAFRVVASPEEAEALARDGGLAFPLFAKPLAEGTGKGIDARSRIDAPAELAGRCRALLEQHRQPVLVEEYLPGREFTTGVLGTGPAAHPIGTLEIAVRDAAATGIYSYENKEFCESLVNYSRLEPGALRNRVEALAVAAYRALECRDGGRVDIRLDAAGEPCFLEVNPLAGLHPFHSDLPMVATAEGMSYETLIGGIVDSARARHGL
ncbi:MAG: D-alanine--D-alanine ligase [Lentisphaeria bacterium]